MNRRDLVVAGVRTPVLEAGPADAEEAVVCLHGNPGAGADYADLLQRVGTFARAVAPDMPGFGRAEKPAHFDHTVPGYARHVAALLEVMGIRRVHLVLHDFGGPWGIEWATQHPDMVASVTFVNTGAFLDYRWHRLAKVWRTPVVGELFMAVTNRPAFRWVIDVENPRPLPRPFLDRMADDFDRDTRRTVLRLYRATGRPARMGERQARALRAIDPPGLVVFGAQDPYLPRAMAEAQREALPRAEIVLLEGIGHWPLEDAPEEVAASVVPFLREQTGG